MANWISKRNIFKNLSFYVFNNLKAEVNLHSLYYIILSANILNVITAIIIAKKTNEYFIYENIFQYVNIICIILLVLASIILYKKHRIYLFVSILLFLDITFYLKDFIQFLVLKQLSISSIYVAHIIVLAFLIILGLILFSLIFRYDISRYIAYVILIFYSISLVKSVLAPKPEIDTTLSISYRVDSISKNNYILLFDEYPDFNIFKEYLNINDSIHIQDFLLAKDFNKVVNVYSNFADTEKSILALLTGEIQIDPNINKMIRSLTENVFSNGVNYNFYSISLFDDINRSNSLISTQFFKNYSNLSTRYIIPYIFHFFSKRGVGNFTDYDDYHKHAISELNILSRRNEKHIVYIHFFTPHLYPLVENHEFTSRLRNANSWIKQSLSILEESDPSAGIVIISDHGLRRTEIPNKFWNRNILYFKNTDLDTLTVNSKGLVGLFNAIKF